MVALYFDSTVSHSVDGLVDNNGCMRLPHDLINLVAFGTDQKGNHALRNKNNDGKGLPSNFFEYLIYIREEESAALIFLFHLFVINLSYIYLYLNISAI